MLHYNTLWYLMYLDNSQSVATPQASVSSTYIAYAQSWREIRTDELTRRVVLSDPHSPPALRVNGVVRNDDGWYKTYQPVRAGDRYYLAPAERVRLW